MNRIPSRLFPALGLSILASVLAPCFVPGAFAVTFPIPSLELNVTTAAEPEEVAVVLEIIALQRR